MADGSTALRLRPYQVEAVEAVERWTHTGGAPVVVELPTGGGKTVVFATLVRRRAQRDRRRALVLAHREELLQQAAKKCRLVWPDARVGFLRGRQNETEDVDIIVASIETVSRPKRLERLDPASIGTVVVDESHHAGSPSYQRVLRHLRVLGPGMDGSKLAVGFTATPTLEMRQRFGRVIYRRGLLEMIRAKYLVPLIGVRLETEVELDAVREVAGEYDEEDLSRVINVANRNELIVRGWHHYAPGKPTIVFASTVQHAVDLAAAFRAAGVAAEPIVGVTKRTEREHLLETFEAGTGPKVLTTCTVLTEGVDLTNVECVIMARPMLSRVLYRQAVGRGTRTHPGKAACIILDVSDVSTRHRLADLSWVLEQEELEAKREARGAGLEEPDVALEETPRERSKVVAVGIDLQGSEVDLFREAEAIARAGAFRWQVGPASRLMLDMGEHGMVIIVPVSQEEGTYRAYHRGQRADSSESISPVAELSWVQGAAEDYVRAHMPRQAISLVEKDARWRTAAPTMKQLELLERYGLRSMVSGLTRGECSDLLHECFEHPKNEGGGRAAWDKWHRDRLVQDLMAIQ